MKMLKVPSVTMNGGRLSRVTSVPLMAPATAPARIPSSNAKIPGMPFVHGEVGHQQRRKDRDGPDRQVDAGGQDDQRLTDGQRGDHRDLLQDDADRLRLDEPRIDDRETR